MIEAPRLAPANQGTYFKPIDGDAQVGWHASPERSSFDDGASLGTVAACELWVTARA
jgi:hypothetical protein